MHKMEVPEELHALLLKGDSRCKFPIGSRIEKVRMEQGANIPIGTKGTVEGNMHGHGHDGYLVKYDNVVGLFFVADINIDLIKNLPES